MRGPKILVLNKIDLVSKPALLSLAQAANERAAFDATFMISALTGDGVADLRNWLASHAPPGPWHYPEDQVSDAPLRHLAAEPTRVFTKAAAASALVFFVLAMQCLPTLAVTRKETGSFKYAALQLGYMSTLAYVAAFVVYQTLRAAGVP